MTAARNGQRIHMEEFAQALQYAPKHKYGKDMVEDYARMLGILNRYSARPAQDVQEFVHRFVSLCGAGQYRCTPEELGPALP